MDRSGKLSIDLRVEWGIINVVVDVDAGCNESVRFQIERVPSFQNCLPQKIWKDNEERGFGILDARGSR